MNSDILHGLIEDALPVFREQLLSAFASMALAEASAAGNSAITTERLRTDIDDAIMKFDRAQVLALLGITPDGQSWPKLDEALEFVLKVELTTVYVGMTSETWEALGVDDPPEIDRIELNSLLEEIRKTIIQDTITGVFVALDQILSVSRVHNFGTSHLLAAIGMTDKQALIFIRANIAAKRLHWALSKESDEDARAHILKAALGKLPDLIASRIRRMVNERGRVLFTEADVERFSKDIARQFRAYRVNALTSESASKAAHLGELAVWKEGQRIGVIQNDARKFWVTMHDERVRHTHSQIEAMNAEGVALADPFKNPLGSILFFPPAELNCRCRVALGAANPGNATNRPDRLAATN